MKKQISLLFLALFSVTQVSAYDSKIPVRTSTQIIKWSGALLPAAASAYLFYNMDFSKDPKTQDADVFSKIFFSLFATGFTASVGWIGYHVANWFTKEGKLEWAMNMLNRIEQDTLIKALEESDKVEDASRKVFSFSRYPLADAFDKLGQYQRLLKRSESILQDMQKNSDDLVQLQIIAQEQLPRIKPLLAVITTTIESLRNIPGFLDQVHLKEIYTEMAESNYDCE